MGAVEGKAGSKRRTFIGYQTVTTPNCGQAERLGAYCRECTRRVTLPFPPILSRPLTIWRRSQSLAVEPPAGSEKWLNRTSPPSSGLSPTSSAATTSSPSSVILPFTVLRRIDCVLEPTKAAVLAEKVKREKAGVNSEPFLLQKASQHFVNTSPLDLKKVMGDQDFNALLPLLEFDRTRTTVDLSEVRLTYHTLKDQGKRPTMLPDGPMPKLTPLTDAGGRSIQAKQRAYLREIVEKVNDLFSGELTDQDKLVYVNDALKGKLLESAVLQEQAANNSKARSRTRPI